MKYSERQFIITGETKPFEEMFIKLNGKYNNKLKNPDNDEKISGWLFPSKTKQRVVSELIMNDIDYKKI